MSERIDRIPNINLPPNQPKKPEIQLKLGDIIKSISLSTIGAKVDIDKHTVDIKRTVYEKDDIMKTLPLNIFNISEMEVDLKFAIENVERDAKGDIKDLIINTTPEKIVNIKESLSTIKFKLSSMPLREYTVGQEKILKE